MHWIDKHCFINSVIPTWNQVITRQTKVERMVWSDFNRDR